VIGPWTRADWDEHGQAISLRINWFNRSPAPEGRFTFGDAVGELYEADEAYTYVEKTLSCNDVPWQHTFSLRADACGGPAPVCGRWTVANDLTLTVTPAGLGCEEPPLFNPAKNPPPGACPIGGGIGGVSPNGDMGTSGMGHGAYLYYRAGGVGHPGFPGSPDWNTALGRYWSHDYAERIVEDAVEPRKV
jgi:hypothetical protein